MQEELAGLANATMVMISALLDDLQKSGLINKADFISRLGQLADQAEAEAPQDLRAKFSRPRFDLLVLRSMKDFAGQPNPPWKPVLIPGGKDDPKG